MGRIQRLKSIQVVLVPQNSNPAFLRDPDHLFSSLKDEIRIAEVIDICARVHAQRILDLAAEKNRRTNIQKAG